MSLAPKKLKEFTFKGKGRNFTISKSLDGKYHIYKQGKARFFV